MHRFDTPSPLDVYLEVGKGSVALSAEDVTETTVEVAGAHADDVLVELSGDQLSIVAPPGRTGFLGGGDHEVHVRAVVPATSNLITRTGSADLEARGVWRLAQVKAGSGSVGLDIVEGPAQLEIGSGDLRVRRLGDQARVKSGSGDVNVSESAGPLSVSSGSGDVRIDRAAGPLVVKTGSGDLSLGTSSDQVDASTGSGDVHLEELRRGRLTARTASGDVVVGVAGGIPVWTDVSSVSGRVHSDLVGAGQPAEGQDHIEIRATTASGDIALQQR